MKSFLIIFITYSLSLLSGRSGESETLKFLQESAPDVHQELAQLKIAEPDVYNETLNEAVEMHAEYNRVIRFSRKGAAAYLEMYLIDFDAVWYSDEIAKSRDKLKINELTEELSKLISDSFDQWMIYEQEKLKKIAADLEVAAKNLDQNARNKSEIVKDDTHTLIEQSREYLKKSKAP